MANRLATIRNKRASALVIVLWLIVLMTMVVTVTARMTMIEGRVSQIAVERIRCRWAARAGVETARALLLADERDTDTLYDLWSENDADLVDVQLDGCQFTAKVEDESSKLDINTMTDAQLAALPDMQAEILDSILDWRDSDDEIRPGGAETGYYLTLTNGYICRNGSLGTIRELLRVKGVDSDLFYGPQSASMAWSENEGWIHYLTCNSQQPNVDADGNPRVNVNQADRDELTNTLGLSRQDAQWVIDNRQFQSLVSLTEQSNNSNNNNNNSGSSGNSSSGGSTSTTTTTRSTSTSSGSNNSSSSGSSRSSNSSGGSQNSGSSTGSPSSNTSGGSGTSSSSSSRSSSSSGSQSSGNPLSWNTVLQKADQIALDGQPFTQGRVNINTAGVIVLDALFGSRELAENIIAYREGLDTGFQSLDELNRVQGMNESLLKSVIDQLALRSSVFRIRSTAVSDATGQSYTVETILNRDDQNGRILYWREQ